MTAHVIRGNNVARIIKSLPLCCLLLAGYSFAASNGASGVDINNYAIVIRETIQFRAGTAFDSYKGKKCAVRIHLSRDGSLSGFNVEGGAPDLCNKVSDVMRGVKKLPPPSSDAVYQVFKDALLDFMPG